MRGGYMRAILVDDEVLALDFLERQLNKISDIEVIGKFTSFELDLVESIINQVDILFLDIEMPEMNGMVLAKKLVQLNPQLAIIFVSAHNDYASEAFELNAIDYLLKPVKVHRLQKTLERLKHIHKDKSFQLNIPLKVNVCRELTFESSPYQYENVFWRTAKTRELFLYLLQHRNKTIRKASIIDFLWQDVEVEKAYSQLYTTIYYMRKALLPFSECFSIKNLYDSYLLQTKNIIIDVVEWEQSIVTAPPISLGNINEFEARMNTYTGPYLDEYDYIWAETERYRLEQLWIDTAFMIADCYYKYQMYDKAEIWYKKICEVRSEEELAHFRLMHLYAELDYGLLVNYQYLELYQSLEELGLEVSPEISDWYYNWRELTRK